ncbi:MAG: hypothetical protein FWD71_01325 [Oscillospiraceae bacterium]|nr:hypothetical protein [Oscillospiraceae bacterium]
MYYLVPNAKKEASIYGFEPDDKEYLAVEELPERIYDRVGYLTQLYADIETGKVWWDWIKLQSEPIVASDTFSVKPANVPTENNAA